MGRKPGLSKDQVIKGLLFPDDLTEQTRGSPSARLHTLRLSQGEEQTSTWFQPLHFEIALMEHFRLYPIQTRREQGW